MKSTITVNLRSCYIHYGKRHDDHRQVVSDSPPQWVHRRVSHKGHTTFLLHPVISSYFIHIILPTLCFQTPNSEVSRILFHPTNKLFLNFSHFGLPLWRAGFHSIDTTKCHLHPNQGKWGEEIHLPST